MKVAVAAATDLGTDSMVDARFGGAPYFVVVTVEGDEVGDAEVVRNPYSKEHTPGQVPQFLSEQGADAVIAEYIGERAATFLKSQNIDAYIGAEGSVDQAIRQMLQGKLNKALPDTD